MHPAADIQLICWSGALSSTARPLGAQRNTPDPPGL